MAFRLTLLELPNLLALLDWLGQRVATDRSTAEAVSRTARQIEQLLASLGVDIHFTVDEYEHDVAVLKSLRKT